MMSASRLMWITFLWMGATHLLCGAEAVAQAPAAGKTVNYSAAIADARRFWNDDSREIADLLRRMRAASDRAGKAEDTLAEARRALETIKREREEALEDVRNGEFCDGCGRTRRDLLAHGESFPHPGQHRRPARPEDYERVEKDFAGRMDIQRRLIVRYEPELNDAKTDLNAAHYSYLVLRPVYHQHLADEQSLRLGKWLDEKTAAETELKSLHLALAATKEKEKAAGSAPDCTAVVEAEKRLRDRVVRARSAEERANQEARFFRKDVLANLDYLGDLAKPIPDRFGVSGAFIAATLRNPPRPVGYTVPAVYLGAPNVGVSELQRLLDGPAPAKSGGEKSVQDLLDGK